MSDNIPSLLLLILAFLAGALAAVAARYAYVHLRPARHRHPEPAERPHPAQTSAAHLPPVVRQQMLESARLDFQAALKHSAGELQKDLEDTADSIGKELHKLGTETVTRQLQHYRDRLAALQQQTEAGISGMNKELAEHQAAMKAKMAEEIAAEKQALVKQIDTKLADAVAAFLTETLQHEVDLGAQSSYLIRMLDEHKAEFSKGVSDET
jgi:hypothetical protein